MEPGSDWSIISPTAKQAVFNEIAASMSFEIQRNKQAYWEFTIMNIEDIKRQDIVSKAESVSEPGT